VWRRGERVHQIETIQLTGGQAPLAVPVQPRHRFEHLHVAVERDAGAATAQRCIARVKHGACTRKSARVHVHGCGKHQLCASHPRRLRDATALTQHGARQPLQVADGYLERFSSHHCGGGNGRSARRAATPSQARPSPMLIISSPLDGIESSSILRTPPPSSAFEVIVNNSTNSALLVDPFQHHFQVEQKPRDRAESLIQDGKRKWLHAGRSRARYNFSHNDGARQAARGRSMLVSCPKRRNPRTERANAVSRGKREPTSLPPPRVSPERSLQGGHGHECELLPLHRTHVGGLVVSAVVVQHLHTVVSGGGEGGGGRGTIALHAPARPLAGDCCSRRSRWR